MQGGISLGKLFFCRETWCQFLFISVDFNNLKMHSTIFQVNYYNRPKNYMPIGKNFGLMLDITIFAASILKLENRNMVLYSQDANKLYSPDFE